MPWRCAAHDAPGALGTAPAGYGNPWPGPPTGTTQHTLWCPAIKGSCPFVARLRPLKQPRSLPDRGSYILNRCFYRRAYAALRRDWCACSAQYGRPSAAGFPQKCISLASDCGSGQRHIQYSNCSSGTPSLPTKWGSRTRSGRCDANRGASRRRATDRFASAGLRGGRGPRLVSGAASPSPMPLRFLAPQTAFRVSPSRSPISAEVKPSATNSRRRVRRSAFQTGDITHYSAGARRH